MVQLKLTVSLGAVVAVKPVFAAFVGSVGETGVRVNAGAVRSTVYDPATRVLRFAAAFRTADGLTTTATTTVVG